MTAQHDIRLLLADVDGALVTKNKVLTEAAKAVVREPSDEAKAQASAVTDSNENEGFAKAVRNFALRTAGS